jgi:hypothetical protein
MKRFNFQFSIFNSTFLLLLAMLVSLGASAQKSKPDTRAYPVAGTYTKLVVGSGFDVVMCDTVRQVMVTVPAEVHKQVLVLEEKGELHIGLHGKAKLKERPRAVIPFNARLTAIEMTAASSFDAGRFEQENLHIYLTGASKLMGDFALKTVRMDLCTSSSVNCKLECDRASFDLSGASSVELRGKALMKMELDLIEASSIDAEKFSVKRIEGRVDGASNAIVWCTDLLNVTVDNASHLTYIGHPRIVDCPAGAMSTVKKKW